MARIILVHGAWHGGWCWETLGPLLAAQGHEVLAPDLPGMGADAAPGKAATLDEWADFIAGLAEAGDGPAILVGHSRGGIVISQAAERLGGAAAALVYIAAVLAPPGKTMNELLSTGDSPPELLAALKFDPDGVNCRFVAREIGRQVFYNETDPAVADAAFDRLGPEPMAVWAAPLQLTDERYGRVPRTYVECLRDGIIPIAVQRAMVADQSCEVISLDTDHSPFFSRPEELAEALDRIARAVA